jgi:hypothetical protein
MSHLWCDMHLQPSSIILETEILIKLYSDSHIYRVIRDFNEDNGI